MRKSLRHLPTRPKREDAAGFGLVELIVVVGVLAVLALVAIPVYGAVEDSTKQTVTEDGARSALISVKAAYEEEGRAAAGNVILKLNREAADDKGLIYLAVDQDPTYWKAIGTQPTTRWNSEGVFLQSDGEAYTKPALIGEITTAKGIITEGDGTMLCVIAYYVETKAEHIAFSGPGCGPAYHEGTNPF